MPGRRLDFVAQYGCLHFSCRLPYDGASSVKTVGGIVGGLVFYWYLSCMSLCNFELTVFRGGYPHIPFKSPANPKSAEKRELRLI